MQEEGNRGWCSWDRAERRIQKIGEASTKGLGVNSASFSTFSWPCVWWDEDVSALRDPATKEHNSFSGRQLARVVWQCYYRFQ